MLEIRLLGTFEVKDGKKAIMISSRPAQSLFAYLVLHAGSFYRREKLAGMLWPDSLEETARDNLRHSLWRIRKALPQNPKTEYLLTDDPSIAFNRYAEYWLDANGIENLAENSTADEMINILSEYQGELLPGFYEEWVVLEREHLASVFEHHMARLMSALEGENRWLDILDWGEHWIKLGQKPEPAFRALMSAHAAKGDMSKVAATYERCIKSLKEIGIEPSEQTKSLYASLKSGRETARTYPTPSKFVVKETISNIPVPLTSLVGRKEELKRIQDLISSSRLLTLTGSGGVGKTRLAIQTAKDSIKKFKDGVVWVGLVNLADANLIPQEIAQSLNVREVPGEPLIETISSYLKPKEVLLVLDNCEHLIRACAQYAEQLLGACPKLKILATSIEGLGLFNEKVWNVPSLPLPQVKQGFSTKELHEFASIELFDERAGNVRSDYVLNENNAKAVTQICQRLDGIPLAIELAAARTKVLTVDEIALRLDDRFSLLTTGSRTAIPRHQTLRATIDWSYELLTETERILFRRLAVFAGGFTLEAAESVCCQNDLKRADILDLLGRLADKSLVIVEQESTAGETRYRMLETIRQYALEKLSGIGEARAIRDQHLDFFIKLAEKAEPKIFTGEANLWFRQLDRELDNLRAAMEWSTNSGKAVGALQIAGSLVYFMFIHGPLLSEWQDRVQQALSRPEGMEQTLARAKALNGFGFMYWASLYPTERRSEIEEALSIGKKFADNLTIATALRNLGMLESIQGNYVTARSLLEESLDIWRILGPEGKMGTARTLMFLGDAAINQDDTERARLLHEEAISILREFGDMNFLAYSVRRLGLLAWRTGDYKKALAHYKESLVLNQLIGDIRGISACLAGFGSIAVAQGKLERAATLMAAVEIQLASIRTRLLPIDKMEYERNYALLRAKIDEKILNKLWIKAKDLSLEETIAFALEETRV